MSNLLTVIRQIRKRPVEGQLVLLLSESEDAIRSHDYETALRKNRQAQVLLSEALSKKHAKH
ncbi:MAG TPA: hypothetical protein VMU35_06055 [Methylomirabilota bacterium]|nr:hypothetical protein [Methylomirabilota bacterium]